MSGSFDPGYAGAPNIERVELTAGGVAGLLVRVEGKWPHPDAPAPSGAVLLVRGDRRQFRFPALPGPPAADGVWRATFSVPAELRPALERELVLELGTLAIRLPAPGPAPPPVDAGPHGATVIDRGVLAERRARRAEVGEERQARRAAEAESLVAELSVKVGRLEADLDELRNAPSEAAAQVADLQRELRVARQRAHAEEQVRLEEVGAARAAAAQASEAADEAEGRVRALEARVAELAADVRKARDRSAEAERALAATRGLDGADRAKILASEAALGVVAPPASSPAAPGMRVLAEALALERRMAAARANDRLEGAALLGDRGSTSMRCISSVTPDGGGAETTEGTPSFAAASLAPDGIPSFEASAVTSGRSPFLAAPARIPAFAVMTTAEPEPPGANAADPDRLDAARHRLRAAAAPLPAPTGPADASRLPRALRRLGRRDPAAGGRVLAALVPAQHLAAAPASYELVLSDVGRFTVTATAEATQLGGKTTGPRAETDAAGLARLVLGSPPRRVLARRGVRMEGRARGLRPLRRLARSPLPWEQLAACGIALDAGLAYRWLALAVDPDWTRGERFTIAHTRVEDPHRPWFVRADDGRPLTVTAEPPRDRPAAEVVCPDAGLAAFFAGVDPGSADLAARIGGDVAAVALLLAWANGRRAC